MQALLNLVSNPGFTGVAGIVIGIVLNNYSVGRRERRRLEHESEERKAQWNREATERQEQRNHEERLMQSEAQDRSIRAYSRFLGMAHTVKHLAQGVSREDLRATQRPMSSPGARRSVLRPTTSSRKPWVRELPR